MLGLAGPQAGLEVAGLQAVPRSSVQATRRGMRPPRLGFGLIISDCEKGIFMHRLLGYSVANLSTGGGCNSLVQCAKLQRLPFLQQPATKKLQILVLWNFFFGITGNTAALASESQGRLVQPPVAVCMPAFAVELSGVGGVILASSEAPCAKLQVRPFVQNPMTLYLQSLVLRHFKVLIPPYEPDKSVSGQPGLITA